MHGHWGACSGHGSEHTLDGRQYDAEIHIVHWNTKVSCSFIISYLRLQYETLENAIVKPDGLAVLGVFVEVSFLFVLILHLVQEGEEEHPEFAKIMSALETSRRKGQKEPIKEALDPAMFLPGMFWTSKLNQPFLVNPREQDVLHVRGLPDHAAPAGVRHMDGL